MSNSSNQHGPQIPTAVDPRPDTPPAGGLRGEGSAESADGEQDAAGEEAAVNRHDTMLNGRTVTVEEQSGVAFADTDAASVKTVDNAPD